MILERFNTVIFIGDDVARTIYAAVNVLLGEDLIWGSLQQWNMNDQDLLECKCDNQLRSPECIAYAITAMDEVKRARADKENPIARFCERWYFSRQHSLLRTDESLAGVPHAYIPVETIPAPSKARSLFKELTYSKPHPWQPSPVILSTSLLTHLDITTATKVLDEWCVLARISFWKFPLQ